MVSTQDDVTSSSSPARPGQALGAPQRAVPQFATLGLPTVLAAVAGLAAAWVAAGSAGLMGHGLRHVLTWLLLATAILADRVSVRSVARMWLLLLAAGAAVAMTASSLIPVNALAAVVVLAALSAGHSLPARRAMTVAALAAMVLAVWQFARTWSPSLWLAADTLGGWIGWLGGVVAGRPLRVGATFAGLDFLVLMAALWAAWLAATPVPRWRRGLVAGAAILGGQLVYLVVLALAADMVAGLPKADPQQGWSWLGMVRAALPWNLPALGAVIQLPIAGAMLGWVHWPMNDPAPAADPAMPRRWARAELPWLAVILMAASTPFVATPMNSGGLSLKDKKVVAYEKGFLNWLSPKHGEYGWRSSVGMYGMLPAFVESLGGKFVKSADLSEADLKDAHVLMLMYPNQPWQDDQLKRIEKFVRDGGSLLVFGEHTVREADGGSRFNDVLKPTAMRVPFDTAEFQIGGWLQSYETPAHPATIGFRDDHTAFGVVIGASVEARWPARPLIVGRWGWIDAGDMGGSAYLGNRHYDSGEKLGDVVLAAEQTLGKGTVVAFGDTSTINNGITIATHPFTSRLLAYLAGRPATLGASWREAWVLVGALTVISLLGWRRSAWRLGVVAGVLAASLAACTAIAHHNAAVLPDGRAETPNNLAYIDTTHLGDFSEESLRPNGLAGLELTLMRNGFLTLNLPEFTSQRLERAGLLISVAPRREFTTAERATLQNFVKGGGIFICTAGYDGRQASQAMLQDFGLAVGDVVAEPGADIPDAQPLGYFKVPYRDADGYRLFVRFWAAWPVACDRKDEQVFAYGRGDKPLILMRRVEKGKVVLIGDAAFPTNQNMEHENGEPFEGMRENADFWRWFLTVLRDQPMWKPPNPQGTAVERSSESAPTTQGAPTDASSRPAASFPLAARAKTQASPATRPVSPAPLAFSQASPTSSPASAPASAPARPRKEARP